MTSLRRTLAQEDAVLFIGSGISQSSGLPTWSGLIDELITYLKVHNIDASLVRAEARRGDLLQAASYGFDKLTHHQIGDFIRETTRYGLAKPAPIHRHLVNLGPSCYITTNYDNLIEQSLSLWQPSRFYPAAITNRHLTETAEIITARKKNFIFKPHGDAADTASIILTREQYRLLLPNGERQAALEALKTLLLTRPIIYLGFSLRDPDFLYIRDILANIFRGGTRDHFAVMPDVSDAEADYWRKNYGIHLISYETTPLPNNRRDHSKLADLLEELTKPEIDASPAPSSSISDAEALLALTRYSSSLTRFTSVEKELTIRVQRSRSEGPHAPIHWDHLDGSAVQEFLTSPKPNAILTGLPGAGKTYALRKASATLAQELMEACLNGNSDMSAARLPVYVDLKLYRGDLNSLIEEAFPPTLNVSRVFDTLNTIIYMDSFNEMPREYLDGDSCVPELQQLLRSHPKLSVVVGSRTSDGLKDLGLPIYALEAIDERDLERELNSLGVTIQGRFESDMKRTLGRPFYLRLLSKGRISVSSDTRPHDLYRSFLSGVSEDFAARFGSSNGLLDALSVCGVEALNSGEEAFPAMELRQALERHLDPQILGLASLTDVVNWLVSVSLIIPQTRSRVTFVHQSVTEYLAALVLVRAYKVDPTRLASKLRLRRWDQALHLAQGLLTEKEGSAFADEIIKADLDLAISSSKYAEYGRDEIVTKILVELGKAASESETTFRSAWLFREQVTVSPCHEDLLRRILKRRGALGAAAAKHILQLKGSSAKGEFIELVVAEHEDYNFCTGLARELQGLIGLEDVAAIVESLELLESDAAFANDSGLVSACGLLFSEIALPELIPSILDGRSFKSLPAVTMAVLAEVAGEQGGQDGLQLGLELLRAGGHSASTAIYYSTEFGRVTGKLNWSDFQLGDMATLFELACLEDEGSFHAADVIRVLMTVRPEFADLVPSEAESAVLVRRAFWFDVLKDEDQDQVFSALEELLRVSGRVRAEEPLHLLDRMEIDWGGHEELLVRLLELRDDRLTRGLLGGSVPVSLRGVECLELGELDFWLDWMSDRSAADSHDWVVGLIGSVLAIYGGPDVKREAVGKLSCQKWTSLLVDYVLPYVAGITLGDLTDDDLSLLLADLSGRRRRTFTSHVISIVATETFVRDRLLPLLEGAEEPFRSNLIDVLQDVGQRHGVRYLVGMRADLGSDMEP